MPRTAAGGHRKRCLNLLLLLAVGALLGLVQVGTASAAVSYLRPDTDFNRSGWALVGATTAWAALDDPVSEAETPTAADYLTTSKAAEAEVDLTSASLAGTSALSASAWFYSPTASQVVFRVLAGRAGAKLAEKTFAHAGWNSMPVTLPATISQSELDRLVLKLNATTTALSQVRAAFLKLTYTASRPRVYWGSWIDGDVYTEAGEVPWGDAPWARNTWNRFESNAHRRAAILHFGQPAPWNHKFDKVPLDLSRERGAIPMMDMDADGVTLSTLNSGVKDASMAAWAKEVAEYKKPFFFRWQWEMNLSTSQLGAEAKASPELFKSVWRRFHDIAANAGATNITWVWCPNVSFPGSTPLRSLYPGNAYVDWTCMDGYNHGTKTPNWNAWTSFASVFTGTYAELTSSTFEGRDKPIMIGETGSTEAGGSKASWVANALGTTLPRAFPKIRAVLWFNWNIVDRDGVEWDWPIESSTAVTRSFANAISSSYYGLAPAETLVPSKSIQPLP
jgi:hypothetical protein